MKNATDKSLNNQSQVLCASNSTKNKKLLTEMKTNAFKETTGFGIHYKISESDCSTKYQIMFYI